VGLGDIPARLPGPGHDGIGPPAGLDVEAGDSGRREVNTAAHTQSSWGVSPPNQRSVRTFPGCLHHDERFRDNTNIIIVASGDKRAHRGAVEYWLGTGINGNLMRHAPLILVFAVVATQATPPDRPGANVMWRFDGNGRFPSIQPPTEWRPGKNILWQTPVEVGGYSSPIVAAGKVFVTAEMGSLICLDLANGKILWAKDLFSKGSKDIPADLSKKLMRGCGGDSKQSTPTPASNGDLVFYINAMGLCACYDMHGSQKWIRIIETAEEEEHFSASPIFFGDRIILSWGCLLALDAKTGKTLWKAPEALPSHGTPVLTTIGGAEVAITPSGDIVKLANGEILCTGLFKSRFTTPLVHGNVLYVVDTQARALELPARAEKGMRPRELWKTALAGAFMASPAYKDGLLYTIDYQRCRPIIIDAKTGAVLTSQKGMDRKLELGIKIDGLAAAQHVYASPAVSANHVYFFDDAGHTAVLEVGRGRSLVRVNPLNEGLVGTPFFVNDKIIFRGTKTVYCVGEKR
jgi:outer membrane protein assembly factor BamB